MHELLEHYELVKEVKLIFDNNNDKITGRIYKVIKGGGPDYTWEVSHYCRLDDEVEPYTPGGQYGNTENEAENGLMRYLKRFEQAVDWRENQYFN